VIYRHLVLTVPERLRHTFSQPSQAVLSPCMRCGVRGLDDCSRRVRGHALPGGSIVVGQTHGRHGRDNPPLHGMAPSGGWDQQAKQWVPLEDWPYPLLRKPWQWPLLTMVRQTVQTTAIHRLVETCSTRYRAGLVTNVPQGEVPARSQS